MAAGCGPVVEYRNDSIVRIDNSFLQKNQFGASPFVFKDQICLFGGSGLFTDKNLITRFDFTNMEWFRVFPKSNESPEARSNSPIFFNQDGFYIFGGFTNIPVTTLEKDDSLWFFNFKTFLWSRVGSYNKDLYNFISTSPESYLTFQTDKKLFLIDKKDILEIDFEKNKLNYFQNKNITSWLQPYYDSNSDSLVYLQYLSGADKVKLIKIPLNQLLKKPYKTENLYFTPWKEYAVYSFFVLIFFIFFLAIYKWIENFKIKCFVYHQTKNKIYYKSKIIINLDSLEEKILIYLFQNLNKYIQLNELNSLFEKESLENFTNVIKKRDIVFSSLLVKLAAIINQEEKQLLLTQKNEEDKRIKEIRLNPLFFTLK